MKTSWNELTIGDWLTIKGIGEMQMADNEEKNMRVAALLAGIDYDSLLQMPLSKVREIMDNTQFLLEEPKSVKARRKYEINGHTYSLFRDPSEMTVAQYIAFEMIYKEGFEKRPVEMLAIFLIPEGHDYNDGYNMEDVMEDMLQMSVAEALGVAGFFIRRCFRLMQQMEMYCNLMMRWQILRAPKEEKEMLRAMALEMKLMLEESVETFGLIASRR